MRLGIAVGRQTHTIVSVEGEKTRRDLIPNSEDGVKTILDILGAHDIGRVAFLGNHRWATPFACALKKHGISCFYFPLATERGKRGKAGNVTSMLEKALKSNATPRQFLPERVFSKKKELPPLYRLAREYLEATNEVRRLKHRLFDLLAMLFPEVVKASTTYKLVDGEKENLPVPQPQPPNLFTKKMQPVLENPDPKELARREDIPEEVRLLATRSLGLGIPTDFKQKTLVDYDAVVHEYLRRVALKDEKIGELKKAVASHPLYELFGGGDVISVMIGLVGWRAWPGRYGWRLLRRFCGLDVSNVDSKGKQRISRVRPETRQYLFLLATRTKIGKETTGHIKGPHAKVKRIEKILRFLRNNGLNSASSSI